MPIIAQDTVMTHHDWLAVSIFCGLGLALSFAFIAYTGQFEQIADLSRTYLGG